MLHQLTPMIVLNGTHHSGRGAGCGLRDTSLRVVFLWLPFPQYPAVVFLWLPFPQYPAIVRRRKPLV